MPVDGAFPTGTSRWEKRAIGTELPIWDPSICIDCGKCAIVCPHAAIRMKAFDPIALADAPDGFQSKDCAGRDLPGLKLTVQVAPDDCTGCGLCVEICPAHSKEAVNHKAINLADALTHRDAERPQWEFFEKIPELDRSLVRHDTVKGSQLLQPLFEFSGACAGCGETPYLKLLSQLFGDRMVVANATGLLLDLRREPADDAVGAERRWARAGVGELALRGQRRVRARVAAGVRAAGRRGASASR